MASVLKRNVVMRRIPVNIRHRICDYIYMKSCNIAAK